MSLHIQIITPERVVFDDQIDQVTLPTTDGEITVLPRHIPLVSMLKAGTIHIKKEGQETLLACSRGVIEINGANIKILTDSADRADELDEAKIQKAKEAAQKLLSEKRHDDEGFAEATAVLERELARLHVVRKHHTRRGTIPNETNL